MSSGNSYLSYLVSGANFISSSLRYSSIPLLLPVDCRGRSPKATRYSWHREIAGEGMPLASDKIWLRRSPREGVEDDVAEERNSSEIAQKRTCN
jgi:hypothetical protein